ncbi:hypothetical protein SAMN04488063_2525 [Halopelagius inordinatus]|uniref:Elongation factor 1-beta n=1 Tax=Halopelagius inordinatus TaxID=553467 RepID=A0A1I2T363_9EURY|nr:hypothetical protein [Halopelagius inordinatus]SFG59392.1 hypothetical protein SAMN04488063_2525 [Halopelagius inordinatus]
MAVYQPDQTESEPDRPAAVRASLTVLVTRDVDGDLSDGVRERLAAIDSVDAVESVEICGLRPALNDLRVDVDAELLVDVPPDDAERASASLSDGFGVKTVESVRLR